MIFLAAAPVSEGTTTASLSVLHLVDRLLSGAAKRAQGIRIEQVRKSMLGNRLTAVPPFVQRITPPELCVAFDVAGLLYWRDVHKVAILPDKDLRSALRTTDLSWRSAGQGLLDLTAALETTDRLLVFDKTLKHEISHFASVRPTLVSAPALSPSRSGPTATAGSILVFDHLGDPGLLAETAKILTRQAPDRALVLCASASSARPTGRLPVEHFFTAAPQLAYAHVHLGVPVRPRLGNRLVDSFACRCPVIQLLPAFDRIGALPVDGTGPETIVRDRSTGFSCTDGTGLEAALDLIRNDAAIVEIVCRNGDRIAETNNIGFEAALRELMA